VDAEEREDQTDTDHIFDSALERVIVKNKIPFAKGQCPFNNTKKPKSFIIYP